MLVEFKELGKTGEKIPVLGLGTWGIGGLMNKYVGGDDQAVRALQVGFELGMCFVDTAEMYARGHSEEVVARAITSQRDRVFIATKVSPDHLAFDDVIRSCESSLRRLETNYIDLYQVHWPNSRIPIPETMRAMEHLVTQGKIKYIGVSNYSARQTREAQEALSRTCVASNQVEYSLLDRSIENDLLPYADKEHVTIIAYSPIGQGRIPQGGIGERWRILDQIASKYGRTRTQVALNWLIAKDSVVAIPKAASPEHVKEDAVAVGWRMSQEDQKALNDSFT